MQPSESSPWCLQRNSCDEQRAGDHNLSLIDPVYGVFYLPDGRPGTQEATLDLYSMYYAFMGPSTLKSLLIGGSASRLLCRWPGFDSL